MIIEDGTGSNRMAEVDSNNMLHVHAVSETHFEDELHHGHCYSASLSNSDMDKSEEINICFTTPSDRIIHIAYQPICSVFAEFKVGEGAAVTATTGTDATAINSNRRFSDDTKIEATYGGAVGKYTANATVTNDGTVIHTEMLGSNKQGAGITGRGSTFNILKSNTTYAFRIVGNGVSSDNGVASIEIVWVYDHH